MDFWHDSAVQKRWLLRLTLFIGLLLVPVFVLAVFARPSADDYIYAARTHAVMQQYGFDLPRLLKAAWDTNVYYFENWQGLYVSGFLLAWQPAIFGNAWYGVTLLCVLVPLFFCLYGACRCVVRRLDQAQKLLPWALALLVCFAFIEGMPAPVEGLYWFNGAMNYLPYFSLAVLNAGLTFGLCFAPQLTRKQRTLYCAAGVMIGFIIGGGHQVAFECAGPIVGRCTVRTAAQVLPSAGISCCRGGAAYQRNSPRHAGTRCRVCGGRLC